MYSIEAVFPEYTPPPDLQISDATKCAVEVTGV